MPLEVGRPPDANRKQMNVLFTSFRWAGGPAEVYESHLPIVGERIHVMVRSASLRFAIP